MQNAVTITRKQFDALLEKDPIMLPPCLPVLDRQNCQREMDKLWSKVVNVFADNNKLNSILDHVFDMLD